MLQSIVYRDDMKNLLQKIEATIHNAHLEPFGRARGVQTVRENIMYMEVGDKYRLGHKKSFTKGRLVLRYQRGGLLPDYKRTNEQMRQRLRPKPLLRSIFKCLYERHAIHATGCTPALGIVDDRTLGESFFGPDTHITLNQIDAKLILRELWLHGHSSKFNKLQKNHNKHQELLKEKNWKPNLYD